MHSLRKGALSWKEDQDSVGNGLIGAERGATVSAGQGIGWAGIASGLPVIIRCHVQERQRE
jgi:hypothetical protein